MILGRGMALPSIQELAQTLGPLAAFVVATFDRSGFPLVVGSVCVTVGLAGGNHFLTIFLGTLGMISGDLFLYEMGRRGGARYGLSRRILRPLRPLQATARALLRKYPSASLLFGRYVAGAGIILPLLAGSFGRPRRKCYLLLIFGSAIYVVPWGSLAFFLGQKFEPVLVDLQKELVWFALAALVAVAGYFGYLHVRRKAKKAAAHPMHHLGRRPPKGHDA
jgi:membrane protein DedA with SNARE-associated domain